MPVGAVDSNLQIRRLKYNIYLVLKLFLFKVFFVFLIFNFLFFMCLFLERKKVPNKVFSLIKIKHTLYRGFGFLWFSFYLFKFYSCMICICLLHLLFS